jgi:hypothetical protein
LAATAIFFADGQSQAMVTGNVDEISIDWINRSVQVSGRDKSSMLTESRVNIVGSAVQRICGWNDCFDLPLFGPFAQAVGVISFVCHQPLWSGDSSKQWSGRGDVATFPGVSAKATGLPRSSANRREALRPILQSKGTRGLASH